MVFQEAQKTQMLNEAQPHDWPMLGHRKRDERAKGEEPTYWIIPHGHLPSHMLVLRLSRVTISADFLG